MLHNDDTSMRVLTLKRLEGDERTGVFTSGIVSAGEGWKIALFFTGREHAGENLAVVLKRRASELRGLIQMRDALSRNLPKLEAGLEICWRIVSPRKEAICRRSSKLPEGCRYTLELLGQVYGHDAEERDRSPTPDERLRFHPEHSGPVMEQLHQ